MNIILNRWLLLKEQKDGMADYFKKNNYKKVAIYGFAAIGQHLYEKLKGTAVEVVCAIDRRQGLSHSQLAIIKPGEKLPDCDVIVVTVVRGAEQIVNDLQSLMDKTVVTLEEVINVCLQE